MDLQDKSSVKHKLPLGECLDYVAVLANDCSGGCDNHAAIRFTGDADDILRHGEPLS